MTDDERRELLEAALRLDLMCKTGIVYSNYEADAKAINAYAIATLAAPQWTSELPTVVGWYWTRYKSGSKPYPLEVEHGDSGLIAGESGVLASEIKCEWAGPITPPGDKP